MLKNDVINLLSWFETNQRDLPWRQKIDPYEIWISEVMLQQTTSQAVISYYQKFLKRFPNVKSLASSDIETIYEYWAGLGYYSRARNLLKAAQIINSLNEFPKTAAELLEIPGFGPYTSRAVSSIAFSEAVGVLDGNVIRVLSRKNKIAGPWWTSKIRNNLQNQSDELAKLGASGQINQALMELGATICTPKNPKCIMCPWLKVCKTRIARKTHLIPKAKPKTNKKTWIWSPIVCQSQEEILLVKNDYAPFLKGVWFLPGKITETTKKPDHFDFKHTITNNDIFVRLQVQMNTKKKSQPKNSVWVSLKEISRYSPTSLIQKVLSHALK